MSQKTKRIGKVRTEVVFRHTGELPIDEMVASHFTSAKKSAMLSVFKTIPKWEGPKHEQKE